MKIRKLLPLLLVAALLVMSLPVAFASAESTTLAAFKYANTNAIAEENIGKTDSYGDKDTGYTATEGTGLLFASVNGSAVRKVEWTKDEYSGTGTGMQPAMTGGTNNPWAAGAYFQVEVATTGYESITFSAQLGGSKKGPRDYKLQVSTDGATFTDVAGATYTITDNKVLQQAFNAVALPADTNNAAKLYIRIAVSGNATIGGETVLVGSTGGDAVINNIVVSGTKAGAAATTTVSGDIATTAAGGTAAPTTAAAGGTAATTAKATPSAQTADNSMADVALLIGGVAVVALAATVMLRKKAR